MTHRGPPPERLPTLTEVIEYVGDEMTVHSLVEAPAAAAVDATECESTVAAVQHLPAAGPASALHCESDRQRLQELLAATRQRIDPNFEHRLREALQPIFERAAAQAVEATRELLAELLADMAEKAISPDAGAKDSDTPR